MKSAMSENSKNSKDPRAQKTGKRRWIPLRGTELFSNQALKAKLQTAKPRAKKGK